MAALVLGYLFVIALTLPLGAAVFSLATRKYAWNNAATQLLLAACGFVGLLAVAHYYALFMQGAGSVVIDLRVIAFVVNPLSAFFLALVSMGTLLTSIFGIGSLPPYRDTYDVPLLNAASALFIFGMQATILAPSLFTFLLFWEIMSVSAYFLVIADRSKDSLFAGWLYFVMTHIGFSCLIAGFLLLAQGNVFATWSQIAAIAEGLSWPTLAVSFFLLLAGFGSKAGLVPLHQWLPYAHPQAPSGSSALLSGVMLKVALFGFLQAVALFAVIPPWWAVVVTVVGLVSALFGALHAAVEDDAKRLLAWSSIENMSLIFSGVGLYLLLHAAADPVLAPLQSAMVVFILLHTLNHFLFKTGLFMAVGAVVSATHTRDLDSMGGLAQAWPFFSGAFLALSLAAAALPPFGTFFGEWVYLQTLALGMQSSPVLAVAFALALSVVALIGGLAIFAYVKMFSAIFLGRARTRHAEHKAKLPLILMLPPAACAVFSLLAGLVALPVIAAPARAFEFAGWIADVAITPQTSTNAWLVLGVGGIIAVVLFVFRSAITDLRTPRSTDTWDCGAPLSARMQYSATGFSAPIRFFFRSILVSRKELVSVPVSPDNRWIVKHKLHWSISSSWEIWLYRPLWRFVMRLARVVRRIQNGVIQLYLVLILGALIVALVSAL